MATQPTIPQILTNAQLRQYQSFNAINKNQIFIGGDLDPRLPLMLYVERRAVQWANTYIPTDPNLTATALYLYWLSGPLITLNNQLLSANLTAVAVSSTEIDLAWSPVPHGVTYTLQRALDANFTVSLTQLFSGNALAFPDTNLNPSTTYYYRMQVSAPGYISSPYAYANATTQSVIPPLIGSFYYGIDYSSQLLSGIDNVPYQGTFPITTGQPLVVPYPAAAANTYLVCRYPATESVKTTYNNGGINQGLIPSVAFNAVATFGGYHYIFSRTGNQFALNSAFPVTFS